MKPRSLDRTRLELLPLAQRVSKTSIEQTAPDLSANPPPFPGDGAVLDDIADAILRARAAGRPVILAFGAHLIKNGLGPLLRVLIEDGLVTHLATNGAGSIHDWEFAFQGKSEEDVRRYAAEGQFGLWDETGRYINLAVLLGAAEGLGYGESVGRLIHTERLSVPELDDLAEDLERRLAAELARQAAAAPGRESARASGPKATSAGQTSTPSAPRTCAPSPAHNLLGGMADLFTALRSFGGHCGVAPGQIEVKHPFKRYSVQEAAFAHGVPLTVHPGLGCDIIYTHPLNLFAAVGRCAEVDFLRFAATVADLDGGVYLSVGSAIMSPMVFEKSLSMARNAARAGGASDGRPCDFLIVVNDIQEGGSWRWGTGAEPPKSDPAYYLRFCKTFDRMGARQMRYVAADNRAFLLNLYRRLRDIA